MVLGISVLSLGNIDTVLCLPTSSFFSTRGGSENDMRFMYCAAAICYILQDFSAINMNSAVQYVLNSMVSAQAVLFDSILFLMVIL